MYNVGDLLQDARGLIETKGWIQQTYHNDYGYCLVGAIHEAFKEALNQHKVAAGDVNRLPGRAYNKLQVVIGEQRIAVTSTFWLSVWNDSAERTKEEVLALLDEASK